MLGRPEQKVNTHKESASRMVRRFFLALGENQSLINIALGKRPLKFLPPHPLHKGFQKFLRALPRLMVRPFLRDDKHAPFCRARKIILQGIYARQTK